MYGKTQELENIKKNIDLLVEKQGFLQREYFIMADANQKFALKKQLETIDEELTQLHQKANGIKVAENANNNATVTGDSNVIIQNLNNSTINITK